jgi:ABC-2 type transport system permease protein
MMFGVVVLPLTFLGGTYYPWTTLEAVKVGGFSWLQTAVLLNPLIYVTEGFRAALTSSTHMHLYIVYPALCGFCALFLNRGISGFKRRVLS